MNKNVELAKNTIIILIAKLCTQLITFLMLPLYTSALSTGEYGLVDLITTYTSLAMPIIGFHLEMGVFRYLVDNRKNENKKSILITNTLITLCASVLFFSILYLAIANIINLPYMWLILAGAIASLFASYFLQVARGLGDNIGYSIGSMVAGISAVIINLVLLLVFNLGVNGILIATAISNTLCVLFLVIREKTPKYVRLNKYDKKEVAKVLKYSAPLIPNSLIWWVINVSDRTIISIFMDVAANGIYAVSNKFSHIINVLYSVFNLSWTESASLHINDKDKDIFFSNTFNTTIKIFTSLSLLMLAFMPIIFMIMVGDGYDEAYLYIPILAIGMIFNIIVSFIGAIYIAKKMTKQVAMTSFWSGVLNIVINVVLIKAIGIWAAALSTLLAFAIMAVYRYFDVQKYVKLKLNKKLALLLIALTGACVAFYYINNVATIMANIVLVTSISIYINRGTIKTLVKSVKMKLLS